MKLLVCVSKTPETTAKIAFTDDNRAFKEEGVQFIMNPYDEWYALVRAIEVKEALKTGTVTVINVGPSSNDPIIRKALAIGADEAVRVNATSTNALYIAKQISAFAQSGGFDILFFGKETIDHNRSEVGSMVAEFLDIPYISYASNMDLNDGMAEVSRDVEGGVEVVEVATPFALSASKGLAEQRIPNMRGIMMAKRKPLKVIEPVEANEWSNPVSYALPPEKTQVKLVDPENMDELVRLLNEEAKVI